VFASCDCWQHTVQWSTEPHRSTVSFHIIVMILRILIIRATTAIQFFIVQNNLLVLGPSDKSLLLKVKAVHFKNSVSDDLPSTVTAPFLY